MSNRRRGDIRNSYRTGYLRSPAWFVRRDRWFRAAAQRGPVVCAACGRIGTPGTLELHHITYRGVLSIDCRWRAAESHDDLVPLHPGCHELIHLLIDRDRVLARARTRRDASTAALAHLRRILAQREEQG